MLNFMSRLTLIFLTIGATFVMSKTLLAFTPNSKEYNDLVPPPMYLTKLDYVAETMTLEPNNRYSSGKSNFDFKYGNWLNAT